MSGVWVRRGGAHREEHAMWRQRHTGRKQPYEDGSRTGVTSDKPRNTRDCYPALGAKGEASNQILPHSSEKESTLPTPSF